MTKWRKFTFRGILLIFMILLAGLSACNLPSAQVSHATQTALSARQTLYANLFPNAPAVTPTQLLTFPETPSSPTPTTAGQTETTFPADRLRYYSQSGDTQAIIAAHFGVNPEDIRSASSLPFTSLLPVGTLFSIPDALEEETPYSQAALPDSEVIYAPGAKGFDLPAYADEAGGYLTEYSETIDEIAYSGPEIVNMVALETSTNPRLLLAFLDFRSNWVTGNPPNAANNPYPIGYNSDDKGLYDELMITARLLAEGYYGWRTGTLTSLTPVDGDSFRISPTLNAGSVALQRLFTSLYKGTSWEAALHGQNGFLKFYTDTFGDAWARAETVEPLLNEGVQQPELALPFLPGLRWSFTAGSHAAWQTGTPRAALDFAPVTGDPTCAVSTEWTTAAVPGLVVRSLRGTLALDLDNDGDEGTGWVLVYMHVAEEGRAALGTQLSLDGLVGHPSCERGNATGSHVHFTRKYNGEWIPTDGSLPLILDGWQAFAGEGKYEGTLVRAYQTVTASSYGKTGSSIYRDDY
jgi:LasA protease